MGTITIVGLGYVGLPLACLCAEKGYKVYGLDIDRNRVDAVNKRQSVIKDAYIINKLKTAKNSIVATTNASECVPFSDIIAVCVPTPIKKDNTPDLGALKKSVSDISEHIKKKSLLIIESTIYPGTVEEIVIPILKKKGFDPYKDEILVAHCPERIDPGNEKWTIENLPRVVGGVTEEATKKAVRFYSNLIGSKIIELKSIKAVEATKIMENTFRDINIAFINEMAMSFDKVGIDVLEVIKGASTKPFAFMPHYPGAGVGGHCIPVDPYYLIEKAKQIGFSHKFLRLAREINRHMPNYTVELLENELGKLKRPIKNAKIGVLGIAYKANVDDVRESPSLKVIDVLRKEGAEIFIFDPHANSGSNVKDIDELLDRSDYLVLITDHKQFKELDLNKFKENNIKIVIDGRNCLDGEKIKGLGIQYHGIGRC